MRGIYRQDEVFDRSPNHFILSQSHLIIRMLLSQGLLRSLAVASFVLLTFTNGTTLTVSTTGGNASSPLLYGLMFEVLISLNLS